MYDLAENPPTLQYPVYESAAEFAKVLPSTGRLLGVDVGAKRIGIATSDVGRMIGTPLAVWQRGKFKDFLKELAAVEEICGVVVGLPLMLSGDDSKQTQGVRAFADNLAQRQDLPVMLWDERWSSSVAHKSMTLAGMTRKKQAGLVDKLAAGYILQGALDALQYQG